MDQETLDDIAANLDVEYKVLDNHKDGKKTYRASITLMNGSSHELKYEKWAINFCHIRMIEPEKLPSPDGYVMEKYGIKIIHVNGCLFKILPTSSFKTLERGSKLEVQFKAEYYSVARSDLMPNWYMTCQNLKPTLVMSTVGEDMKFVQPFDKPETWKRFDYTMDNGKKRFDHYDPFTAEKRFEKNEKADLGRPGHAVIPTPVHVEVSKDKCVNLSQGEWTICAPKELKNESKYLADKLGLPMSNSDESVPGCAVVLAIGEVSVLGTETNSKPGPAESYCLSVSSDSIHITGADRAGVFYGAVTLLSLLVDKCKVPEGQIRDTPRYPYRGMHLDVSRNFHCKEQVLKLLDVMALYKLNVFHFHLTDDEGWRLEIPGLEELTKVGARRGHSTSKNGDCLLPLLGSGPNFDTSGSGFYTVQEYKEILQYAKDRHIEVIPEIDMPGHSHAAIKSMKVRYDNYMAQKKKEKAEEFLLTDLEEPSDSRSVQMFSDNAMNPGMESAYRFAEKVVVEVKKMHEEISPLKTFHLGGDEVPYESWEDSPACHTMVKCKKVKSFDGLMEYFVTRVAGIVAKHDLNLGAWQDGVITDEETLEPVKRKKFKNKEVSVYAWQNVWESGKSGCAYRLANSGYKVVMAQGTHLYFDHPYEPDPEERGLYWAARYLDTEKTFNFLPDNIYANADVKLTGEPVPKDFLKSQKEEHDELENPENIIGIQGQLWSELVRTPDQMDSMIFPRLLPLAERAWHKAPWEDLTDLEKLREGQKAGWQDFANTLGYKELSRLDELGVTYHIPPPGARLTSGKLEMNVAYPGLPLYYKTETDGQWLRYTEKVKVDSTEDIQLMSKSFDEKHCSRIVTLKSV